MTLDDATLDRLARRIAWYLRRADQQRVDADLAAEHRRQVKLSELPMPSGQAPSFEEWRKAKHGD